MRFARSELSTKSTPDADNSGVRRLVARATWRSSIGALAAGALLVTGLSVIGAGATTVAAAKKAPVATTTLAPTPKQILITNCEKIIATSTLSPLAGVTVLPGDGIKTLGGECYGNYATPDMSTFNEALQLQISANKTRAAANAGWQQQLTKLQAFDQACPTSADYPTLVPGLGTHAFTYGQCQYTAPGFVIATDGVYYVYAFAQNGSAGISIGSLEAIVRHIFTALAAAK